ncbi:hypothetical protein Tco_1293628 [Tanacetum coccineum]
MEDEFYGLTVNGSDLKAYIRRFQELAFLCPNMVPNSKKLMEAFIGGLPQSIEGKLLCQTSDSGKDWKDKKKQKRSKTDKKREKDKESRARVRSQPEFTSRISPTQSKTEIKEVKSQITSQRAKVDKCSKFKGYFEVLKSQGPKLPRSES